MLRYLIDLWKGNIPLPITFWVYGVGVTFFLTIITAH